MPSEAVNTNSLLISELRDKTYRDAYVRSQITTGLPFKIRALRKSKGWNQQAMAERAGMAQSRIPDLERPVGKFPNLETLCRIASAFDVGLEVRFVPFSELVERSDCFDPESFAVPSFEEELVLQDADTQTIQAS